MLRVLDPGVAVGAGTSAYRTLKAVGDLAIGRFGSYVQNPSDGNRLGVTLPSGTGAQVVGIIARNPLDVAGPRTRQTAAPTDSVPAGTWELVDAQEVHDQEPIYVWTNGGTYETDQYSTGSGTFDPGDYITYQTAAGADCGKALACSATANTQKVGIVIGQSTNVLRFQSLLP